MFDTIMKLTFEEILSLSSEECYAYATILMNYAGFLQKQLDRSSSLLSYCNGLSDYEFAKEWGNHDKYMPAEIKKNAIMAENSYLLSIEKCRVRLRSACEMLSESCRDIKKRVSIFQDLGKKRSFN
jgi:hypothetical protein